MDEASYRNYGIYTLKSFTVFANKIGVHAAIAERIIDESMKAVLPATDLIDKNAGEQHYF